jgi:hypothetical protein
METFEGAAPIFVGPCTLARTWGTRPILSGLGYDLTAVTVTDMD